MNLTDLRKMSDADLIKEISYVVYFRCAPQMGPEAEGDVLLQEPLKSLRLLADELEWRHVIKPASKLKAVPTHTKSASDLSESGTRHPSQNLDR